MANASTITLEECSNKNQKTWRELLSDPVSLQSLKISLERRAKREKETE